jgi:hypothetical protein
MCRGRNPEAPNGTFSLFRRAYWLNAAAVADNGFVHRIDAKTYGDAARDMSAAKWTLILFGSLPSRETAIVFADEFNRKEKLEALVMSSSN